MVEDLNLSVRLVICPTVREADGLAMSFRNTLLSREARKAATALRRSLRHGQTLAQAGEAVPQTCSSHASWWWRNNHGWRWNTWRWSIQPDLKPVKRISARDGRAHRRSRGLGAAD